LISIIQALCQPVAVYHRWGSEKIAIGQEIVLINVMFIEVLAFFLVADKKIPAQNETLCKVDAIINPR
jgi:hypothetical protein